MPRGLARRLTELINNEYLGKVAEENDFQSYLRVGWNGGTSTRHMLACCFEAVIAAVFLDSGENFAAVRAVVRRLIFKESGEERLKPPQIPVVAPQRAPISRLSEVIPTMKPVARSLPRRKPPPPPKELPPIELVTDYTWDMRDADPKAKLRKIAREKFGHAPDYKRSEGGGRQIVIEVYLLDTLLGKAQGATVADASFKAATQILRKTKELTEHLPLILEEARQNQEGDTV